MNMNLHQAQSHDILRSWQSQRNDINHHKDFVLPIFIGNNDHGIEPIEAMPDVNRYGVDSAVEYLEPLVYSYGLRAVLLFPVVTKSDKVRLDDEEQEVSDDDDEADDTQSNSSQFSSSSSSSVSSADQQTVLPERLRSEPDTAGVTVAQNSSQNPFLNQNEEEEDHLLAGEQGDGSSPARPPPTRPPIPSPPPRASEGVRRVTRSQDVRLIKGMALSEKFNPVMRLIPKLRAKFPQLLIICDVCLCAFTSTGHCCLFDDHSRAAVAAAPTTTVQGGGSVLRANPMTASNNFPISNKMTCQYLAMLSVEYARRGCNVVAPSDMMDGRILTIREKLNELNFRQVSIISYSAKFASAFYGPFRQATENAPEFGDRRAYQLPPGSRALALKAVERDINQGADFVMVKPGGAYLDIVRDIKEAHPEIPIAVYQVSGEYSMLKIAAKAGVIDLNQAVNETLTAYRRAGATIIISYFTPELLKRELHTSD